MKKTIFRILIVAVLSVATVLSLASCDMLPESITSLIGGKKECAHTEVEWVIDVASTCKLEGTQHSKCKSCGITLEHATVPVAEHELGDWEVDYESTCVKKGSRYRKCLTCKSRVEVEELPLSNEHNYSFGGCTNCHVDQPASAGLEFESLGGGTATVVGIGTCKDASLVIPELTPDGERVVAIESGAFLHQSSITTVVIPKSITTVGANAFTGTSLTKARVPAAIVNAVKCESIVELHVAGTGAIPASAMAGAPNLAVVVMNEGVTAIGDNGFDGCAMLQSVVIPDSLQILGTRAFSRCDSLSTIKLGAGVVKIGDYAFNSTKNIRTITIPASVKYIGVGAFACFTASNRVNKSLLTSVTFEVTDGWFVANDPGDTLGMFIDEELTADKSAAAILLNATYAESYLKRN